MQCLLATDEELSSVKVLHWVLCKSAPLKFMNQCCAQLGASLCLFFFFFQHIGQRKVIYSKEFVVLTSEQNRVLVFENQREIRECLGCSRTLSCCSSALDEATEVQLVFPRFPPRQGPGTPAWLWRKHRVTHNNFSFCGYHRSFLVGVCIVQAFPPFHLWFFCIHVLQVHTLYIIRRICFP